MSGLPRVQCSWCRKVLREGSEPTSHGICTFCASLLRDAETRPAWKGSLGRLGKAQARLWHDTSLSERQRYLALVDAEQSVAQADGDDGRTPPDGWHEEHEEL